MGGGEQPGVYQLLHRGVVLGELDELAAPKQSGTPTWLIALLLVAAIVIAYLFLTSS